MDPLPLLQFVQVIEGELLVPGPDERLAIEHVATHSRRLRRQAAFFALPGTQADGHDYVKAAVENGAAAVVVRRDQVPHNILSAEVPVIAVESPLRSLQLLAAWWRMSLDARFVAVVGSNGKTITKDCLVQLLSERSPVYGTPGSYNSQLGVPLAILDCPRTATVAVIEIAVSDPGEMAPIAAIVQPDDVVLTNVGARWRYRFAGRAHQIGELVSIARRLPPDGWLLLGEDTPDLLAQADTLGTTVLTKSSSEQLPIFTRGRRDPTSAEIEVDFPGGVHSSLSITAPSDEILTDVELAISAAWLLGVDARSITNALVDYTPTSTRTEIWRSPTGVTLVRDIASPDPLAVTSALRAARRLTSHGGRTIVVLGQGLTEWDEEATIDLAQALAAECPEEIVGVRGTAQSATATAVEELDNTIRVHLFDTPATLRSYLLDNLAFGDVCLVQSPPGSRITDISSSLIEAMAPTRLYLDMSAMEENVTTFRRLVGPSVRITAMVKALAYGTDATAVSLALRDSGVDFLGVSDADEGTALRRAGLTIPIIVFLGTEDDIEKMVRYRLTPLLYSERMVEAVSDFAKVHMERISVHLEVDTGMHRSGLIWDDHRRDTRNRSATECLHELAGIENIHIEGLMTHLASADDPDQDDTTLLQLERFNEVVEHAHALGLSPILHAAATAGTIRFPAARYDMVRIGLGLFGLYPSPATAEGLELSPVVSFVSRILQVVEVPEGEGVGYGGTWRAPAGGGRVGVVRAGYHDCIPRALSNFGHVIVADHHCQIIGRVSMDSMNIDLSNCSEGTVGSEVLIYGRLGSSEVRLEEVSRAIGTIPYEVMARVGPRVQRIVTRH